MYKNYKKTKRKRENSFNFYFYKAPSRQLFNEGNNLIGLVIIWDLITYCTFLAAVILFPLQISFQLSSRGHLIFNILSQIVFSTTTITNLLKICRKSSSLKPSKKKGDLLLSWGISDLLPTLVLCLLALNDFKFFILYPALLFKAKSIGKTLRVYWMALAPSGSLLNALLAIKCFATSLIVFENICICSWHVLAFSSEKISDTWIGALNLLEKNWMVKYWEAFQILHHLKALDVNALPVAEQIILVLIDVLAKVIYILLMLWMTKYFREANKKER